MSIAEYESLSKQKKYEMIVTQGTFMKYKTDGESTVYTYSLDDFYVQVNMCLNVVVDIQATELYNLEVSK